MRVTSVTRFGLGVCGPPAGAEVAPCEHGCEMCEYTRLSAASHCACGRAARRILCLAADWTSSASYTPTTLQLDAPAARWNTQRAGRAEDFAQAGGETPWLNEKDCNSKTTPGRAITNITALFSCKIRLRECCVSGKRLRCAQSCLAVVLAAREGEQPHLLHKVTPNTGSCHHSRHFR